jgi:hypothetical protein
MDLTATYSPEDNKLRLYVSTRLDAETYAQVKAAGFSWAPRQQLFVAPMWTPQREDLLIQLCGEIGDEDKSLVQRATERAERFDIYSENRAKDAELARKQVDSIVQHIPFGQPILVGHHSERRARRDVERIDNGMRKSIQMWDASKYWTARAEAAISDAKYKERPDVRARRIKKLEAEERKQDRILVHARNSLAAWNAEGLTKQQALIVVESSDFYLPRKEGDRPDFNQRPHASTALKGDFPTLYAPRELEEIVTNAKVSFTRSIAHHERWQAHFANRLAYERAMLKQDGGIVADKNRPEVGGACKCWASPRGGWSNIQKVNKVSVTVRDNWGNGGRDFTRTIPFDKLREVMSKAEVDLARQEGRLIGEQPIGFILAPKPQPENSEAGCDPAQKPAPTSVTPVNCGGIETPQGRLVRASNPQPTSLKTDGPSLGKGMHL